MTKSWPTIYANSLRPGMIIEAKGRLFLVEDAYNTGENRVRITWQPLGEIMKPRPQVSVNPRNTYRLVPPLVIEELPL